MPCPRAVTRVGGCGWSGGAGGYGEGMGCASGFQGTKSAKQLVGGARVCSCPAQGGRDGAGGCCRLQLTTAMPLRCHHLRAEPLPYLPPLPSPPSPPPHLPSLHALHHGAARGQRHSAAGQPQPGGPCGEVRVGGWMGGSTCSTWQYSWVGLGNSSCIFPCTPPSVPAQLQLQSRPQQPHPCLPLAQPFSAPICGIFLCRAQP